MSQKIEINIRAIDDASSKIGSMAKNIDRSLDDVNRSSDEVVRNQRDLERAIDDTSKNATRDVDVASREIDRDYDDVNRSSDDIVSKQRDLERVVDDVSRNATDDVDTTSKEIVRDYDEVNKKSDEVVATQKKVEGSMKDMVVGFSGVATSAFSLYNAYDRVADMQLNVDRANLKVTASANSLEDAQRRQTNSASELEKAKQALSVAIEKYGADSDEAATATENVQKKLEGYNAASADAQVATERYDLNVQAATQTQDNFNEAIIQSAIQIVPTAITLVDNIGKVSKSLSGSHEWIGQVGAKLAGLKDIDFSGFLAKLGLVDTSLKSIAATAGVAAASIASIAGIIYIGYEQGKKTTVETITAGVPLPSGVTAMNPQGAFGGLLGGIIPWKQHGGIFDSPTVIGVGEAGAEAVIPLDRVGGSSIVDYYDIKIFVNAAGSSFVEAKIAAALKSVIVKASSSGAPAEQKSIQVGNTFAPSINLHTWEPRMMRIG